MHACHKYRALIAHQYTWLSTRWFKIYYYLQLSIWTIDAIIGSILHEMILEKHQDVSFPTSETRSWWRYYHHRLNATVTNYYIFFRDESEVVVANNLPPLGVWNPFSWFWTTSHSSLIAWNLMALQLAPILSQLFQPIDADVLNVIIY